MALEEIGLYAAIHHFVFLLVRFDLRQAVLRYGSALSSAKEKRSFVSFLWVVSTIVYGMILMGVLGIRFFLGYLWSYRSFDLEKYGLLIAFTGYTVFLNITLKAWHIVLEQLVWPNFFQHIILNGLLSLWITLYGFKLIAWPTFLLGTFLPYLINLVLLMLYLWRKEGLSFPLEKRFFSFSFLRRFLAYAVVTMAGSNMATLMMRFDNVMIFMMCGKRVEGMYHIAGFITLLLEVPMKVIKQTYAKRMVFLLQKKEYSSLQQLYQRGTQWQLAWTSFLCTLFYLGADLWFYSLPSESLYLMKLLFLVIGLGKLIDSFFRLGHEVLLFSRHFLWSLLSTFLVVVGVLGNYFFIRYIGVLGASCATALFFALSGGVSGWLVQQRFGLFPWSLKPLLYCCPPLWVGVMQLLLPYTSTGVVTSLIYLSMGLAVLLAFFFLIVQKGRGKDRSS